jgi:hypothetical protein
MNTKQDRALAAADTVTRAMATMGFDTKAFAEAITHEHRTIQQSTFRAMLACIERWAADAENGNYDARNEGTVMACKAIKDALSDDIFLPYI